MLFIFLKQLTQAAQPPEVRVKGRFSGNSTKYTSQYGWLDILNHIYRCITFNTAPLSGLLKCRLSEFGKCTWSLSSSRLSWGFQQFSQENLCAGSGRASDGSQEGCGDVAHQQDIQVHPVRCAGHWKLPQRQFCKYPDSVVFKCPSCHFLNAQVVARWRLESMYCVNSSVVLRNIFTCEWIAFC